MHPHTVHWDDHEYFLLDPGLSREDNFVQWQEANMIIFSKTQYNCNFHQFGWLKYKNQEADQRKIDRN